MKSLTSSPTWQDYLWQKWLPMMLLKRSREKEKTLQREIGLPLILRIKLMEGTGIHTMREITQWINRNLSLTLVTNRTMPHVRDNKIALTSELKFTRRHIVGINMGHLYYFHWFFHGKFQLTRTVPPQIFNSW